MPQSPEPEAAVTVVVVAGGDPPTPAEIARLPTLTLWSSPPTPASITP